MHFGPIFRAMRHNRARFALIVIEIAITLAIVSNCVNMILTEREQMLRKSGFDDENLVSVSFSPFAPEFKQQSYTDQVVYADLRALRAIPGVKSAAATYMLPWAGGGSSGTFRAEGYPEKFQAQSYPVYGKIAETLGAKLVQGRDLTEQDAPTDPNTSPSVIVISESLAKKLWGNANPIGKLFLSNDGQSSRTVIGVVGEFYNPYSWNIGEYVRFSPSRWWDGGGANYLIRTEPGALRAVAPQLEAVLLKANPGRMIRVQTIPEVREQFFTNGRLVVTAMSAVIVALIFVTALGILGITSLAVSERTRQIGTRRALGATRPDIIRHFVAENWIVTTIGLVLGVLATYGLNIALMTRLTDAKMPWYLVLVGMVLLWLNGIIATIPPALRAASLAPSIATRSV